jgi:hypothetical protein
MLGAVSGQHVCRGPDARSSNQEIPVAAAESQELVDDIALRNALPGLDRLREGGSPRPALRRRLRPT